MCDKIYVFGHQSPDTDSVCSSIAYAVLKEKLGCKNVSAYRLGKLNKETEFVLKHFNVKEPELLEELSSESGRKKVILIDHNERNQSVSGIENCEVLEIIDHHRVADIQTDSPLYIRIEPVGCTATIIYKMYIEAGIEIPKQIAGIMLSAILSDTLIFASPTCTENDKKSAEALAKMIDVNIQAYGREMFVASTSLEGFTPEEILNIDRKKFTFGSSVAYISQVNTMDFENTLKLRDELFSAMDSFLETVDNGLAILMITDIEANASELLVRGADSKSIRKAFGVEDNKDSVFLEGVVSRKKQIIPKLTLLLQ